MSQGPAVLLVHGAWHGAWCWEALRPILERAGRDVHVVDLPTVHAADKAHLGLADDADTVRAAIQAIDGPVVVVGHSYGGAPVSVAAAGQPNVVHIVYIAAFVLDAGESLLGAVGGEPPSWWTIDGDLVTAGNAQEPPVDLFFGDVPADVAAAAVARLKSQALRPFTEALTAAAWHDVPSTYVVTERDGVFPVPAQEGLAARAGSTVVRLDTSHSPFLSQPVATADIILGAA